MDPAQNVVAIDLVASRINYATDIVQHEQIHSIASDEELVRAFVVTWLCVEGAIYRQAWNLRSGIPSEGRKVEASVKVPSWTSC